MNIKNSMLPESIQYVIYRYVHEMKFSSVMCELVEMDLWDTLSGYNSTDSEGYDSSKN